MTFSSLILINLIIIFAVFVSNVLSLIEFLDLNCIFLFLELIFERLGFCHVLNNVISNGIINVMFNVNGLLMICFMMIMNLVLVQVNGIVHLLVSFFVALYRFRFLVCYDISQLSFVHSIF